MARPRKNVSAYFGRKIQGTKLKVIRGAGRDSRGRIRVKVLCDCGKRNVVSLSQVLSGHTKSCGCLKHQRYVEHTKRAVDRLSPTQIRQCFLAIVDKDEPKPALPSDVIKGGYYRRAEQLKALPYDDMVEIRFLARRHEKYAQIAEKSRLHPAEIAWIYKHVIKPEIKKQRNDTDTQNDLKDFALCSIAGAKGNLEEQKRNRFWGHELHTPGSKPGSKVELGWAWEWMMKYAPFMKLNSKEEDLLSWFRLTAARTFQMRRDKRRGMAQRELEKRCNEIEAAA